VAIGAMAVVASLVAFSPGAPPATAGWAGNTGGTGCTAVNMAGYSSLSFYYWNLSGAMTSAEDWVRSNDVDPTDLGTYNIVSQSADVVVRDLDYSTYCGLDWYSSSHGGGTTGLTTCDSLLANGRCSTHSIRYSTNYTSIASTSQRRGLACHETGHSIGLTHATSSSSCMVLGATNPAQGYNSTEIGWINAAY
jgi:hypothetical protein